MKIGNNIKRIRESRGISIDDMVSKLKIFKRSYLRIEKDVEKVNPDLLRRIAKIFNLRDKDIINYTDEQERIDNIKKQQLELRNLTFVEREEKKEEKKTTTISNLLSKRNTLLKRSDLLLGNKLKIKGFVGLKPSTDINDLESEDIIESEDFDPFEGLNYERGTSFSVKLLNYVEPYKINGVEKTLFYTEVNSGIKVGDKVFIINGFYDSDLVVKNDKYGDGVDGYNVLFVDRCRIVLDINYTGDLPILDNKVDDFINLYYIRNKEDFLYVNRQITTRGGNFDYKFNAYQNNIIYVDGDDSEYEPILDEWGESLGLTGSPGFFVKNGTQSWINITNEFITGSFSIALSPTYSNNNTLRINYGSFTYSIGPDIVSFKEGFTYKWDQSDNFNIYLGTYSTWKVDVRYLDPIITKGNFRKGDFKGNFNSGLYGNSYEVINWLGNPFNSGTIYNSNIIEGDFNSIYTLKESFISGFDEDGNPFQNFIDPNNNGRGYSYLFDCDIYNSNIDGLNIYGGNIGTPLTFSTIEEILLDNTIDFKNEIKNSYIKNSNIESSSILKSEVVNSRSFNSYLNDSKIINTNFKSTYIDNSIYISEEKIKIIDYDSYTFSTYDSNVTHQIYRFYISENAYKSLKIRDRFYIKGIEIVDDDYPLNFFDKRFRLSTWTEYIDFYRGDIDTLTGDFYKRGYQTAAFLSTKEDNSWNFTGGFNNITLNQNPNYNYSIDIVVSLYDIEDFKIENSTHTKEISNDFNYNEKIDISNAYIINSDFESGIFNSSTWVSGNHINYNNDVNITQPGNFDGIYNIEISISGEELLLNTQINSNFKESGMGCLAPGNIIYLNSLEYDLNGDITLLPDTYKIIENTGTQLTVKEIGTNIIQGLSPGGTFSTIDGKNRWGYVYKAKINNSKIISGLFRRGYFKNNFIENERFDMSNIDFVNLNNLKRLVISDSLFKNNNNELSKGLYINSNFVEGDDSILNIISYNSVWNGGTFSNGVFKESRWIKGDFEDGIFYNNRTFNAKPTIENPINGSNIIRSYYKTGITSGNSYNNRYSWENGNFNNGEFFKSDWENGNFNDGKFYYSKFYNGVINGGRIGDNSIPGNNTRIYSGDINYTIVENANIIAKDTSLELSWIWQSCEISLSPTFGQFIPDNLQPTVGSILDIDVSIETINGDNVSNFLKFLEEFDPGQVIMQVTRLSDKNEYFSLPVTNIIESGNLFLFSGTVSIVSGSTANGDFLDIIELEDYTISFNPYGQLINSVINWNDGIFNKGVFGTETQQVAINTATWNNGFFNGGDFISMAKWKNGTFNGGNFRSALGWTMSDSLNKEDYSWEDGIFNGGSFGNANGSTNSTWFTGEFNGGEFNGRVWNNGVFTFGEFNGSGETYSAIGGMSSSNANEFVLSFTNSYYGLWRDGIFTTEKDKFLTNQQFFTTRRNLSNPLRRKERAIIRNSIWISGTFSHASGEMNNCVWLDGTFESGVFKQSSFNPYVITSELYMSYRLGTSSKSFNKNDSTCIWKNGELIESDFYYSKWENGTFTKGDSYGMLWKDGVCNYMNAYNICWSGGLWRNGNWYGSEFLFDGSIKDVFALDILERVDECIGLDIPKYHIWNIFEDDTDFGLINSSSASTPLNRNVNPPFLFKNFNLQRII